MPPITMRSGPGICAKVWFNSVEFEVNVPTKFGVKYTVMMPDKLVTPNTNVRNGHVIRPFQSSRR